MEITRFDPATDDDALAAYVDVGNARRQADAPWVRPLVASRTRGYLTLGWDNEPTVPYLGTVDGAPVAAGTMSLSERENLHLAWLGLVVHPDHRRRGLGSQLLETLLAEARSAGRTSVGVDGWDSAATRGFAAAHGFEVKSVGVNRRQLLGEVDWELADKLYDDAQAAAAPYELLRWAGHTPEEQREAVAVMTNAINDAPTDDLDIEDEEYDAARVRDYEDAQAARGLQLFRVVARHRDSGELAGHTVVVVDRDDPTTAEQHDTSVVAGHRGHRLGTLLKVDMMRWLRDSQPQVAQVDTWNAETNGYMIGVNEALGYRVMGRELEFQREL